MQRYWLKCSNFFFTSFTDKCTCCWEFICRQTARIKTDTAYEFFLSKDKKKQRIYNRQHMTFSKSDRKLIRNNHCRSLKESSGTGKLFSGCRDDWQFCSEIVTPVEKLSHDESRAFLTPAFLFPLISSLMHSLYSFVLSCTLLCIPSVLLY